MKIKITLIVNSEVKHELSIVLNIILSARKKSAYEHKLN